MKFWVDVRLPAAWVDVLSGAGFEALHWSVVGPRNSPDGEILLWAREHGHALFSHDLDFGTILAATGATAPSVVQLRGQDVDPETVGSAAILAIREHHVTRQRCTG